MAGDVLSLRETRCERARQWCSLRLDAELSEVETRLLKAHLDRCSDCRAFAETLRSSTTLLRSSPTEAPARDFEAPTPRRRRLLTQRRLAVAAIVATAALGGLLGSLLNGPSGSRGKPASSVSVFPPEVAQLPVSPLPWRGAPPASLRRHNLPEDTV